MIGIKQIFDIKFPDLTGNCSALYFRIGEELGFCTLASEKKSKGMFSGKWAGFLCHKTPLAPFNSNNGLSIFIQSIWQHFYDESTASIKDPFVINAFEAQGSMSTYTACWFRQANKHTFFQWLSYGNSAVLVYDLEKDDLFIPEYGKTLLGFLKNKGLLNWKDEKPEEKYLLTVSEQEFHPQLKIILANKNMAEYLAVSYLIIKSKEEAYWNILSQIMHDDKEISDYIFRNRNAYEFESFNQVLLKLQEAYEGNQLTNYINQLKASGQLGEGDLIMQLIGYDPDGKEFITPTKPAKEKIVKPPIVYKIPEPIIKTGFPEIQVKQHQYKKDKDDFINFILDNQILKLYHFTDKSNIPSIKKMGGLFSWEYMSPL
jgi:hypothetical protein